MKAQALAILAAASVANAATPAGFQPASQTQLFVSFGGLTALNGQVITKEGKVPDRTEQLFKPSDKQLTIPTSASASEPTLATAQRLPGQYIALMIDLDIPQTPPTSLLHWMSGSLVSSATPVMLGTQTVFPLRDAPATGTTQVVAEAAPYFGPNPPARNPLSHRYTEILVDITGLSTQAIQTLTGAAATRLGFDAMRVLASAGIPASRVVAGNFFNVTNPGPAMADNGNGGMFNNGTMQGTGVNTLLPPRPTSSILPGAAAGIGSHAGGVLMGLVAVAGIFLAL